MSIGDKFQRAAAYIQDVGLKQAIQDIPTKVKQALAEKRASKSTTTEATAQNFLSGLKAYSSNFSLNNLLGRSSPQTSAYHPKETSKVFTESFSKLKETDNHKNLKAEVEFQAIRQMRQPVQKDDLDMMTLTIMMRLPNPPDAKSLKLTEDQQKLYTTYAQSLTTTHGMKEQNDDQVGKMTNTLVNKYIEDHPPSKKP